MPVDDIIFGGTASGDIHWMVVHMITQVVVR